MSDVSESAAPDLPRLCPECGAPAWVAHPCGARYAEDAAGESEAGCVCDEKPCRHSRRIGDLAGPAHRCPLCEGEPKWAITRSGDVATSWACAGHLDRVLDLMQRDHEVTRLEVRSWPKALEWVELRTTFGGGNV